MNKNCALDPALHACRFMNRKTLQCENPDKCSMQAVQVPDVPERKEKWYERYCK